MKKLNDAQAMTYINNYEMTLRSMEETNGKNTRNHNILYKLMTHHKQSTKNICMYLTVYKGYPKLGNRSC